MSFFTLSLACPHADRHERLSRVLDAYAWRIARDTWQAVLSEEAMRALRQQVRPLLTRKSALVCRDEKGVRWVMGARTLFNREGLPALSRRARLPSTTRLTPAASAELTQAVAHAGWWHDLGKNTEHFAWKLQQSRPVSDAIRHEMLSWAQMRGHPIEQAAAALLAGTLSPQLGFLAGPHQPGIDGLDFLVLTHHRLFALNASGAAIDLRAAGHVAPEKTPGNWRTIDPRLSDVRAQQRWVPSGVREAVFARLALMLADHFVSSVDVHTPGAVAAVVRRHLDQVSPAQANPRQTLAGHLNAVGNLARVVARFLLLQRWRWVLPALDVSLDPPTPATGRFAWQEEVATLAKSLREPALVLMASATGTGKTQAAARIAQAIQPGGVRLTVALGLRTLTLQTGEVYRQRLGLDETQLRVLIGSRAILKLHQSMRDDGAPEDASAAEDTLEMDGAPSDLDALPAPLSAQFRRGEASYLKAPVLVTTIDQIIKAADHRQAGWIKPFLRLMSAPLVIDEIDGYDAADLPAVLRLVYFAALVGQTVIASSATIYPALAEALVRTYRKGREDAGAAQTAPVLLAGHVPGISRLLDGSQDFSPAYAAFCQTLCAQDAPLRQAVALPTGAFLRQDEVHIRVTAAIWQQALALHATQALPVTTAQGATRLSLGLVRIAHVRHLVRVAQALDAHPEDDRVDVALVVYHSRNTVLARSWIEQRLDRMLQRSQDALAAQQEPAVAKRLEQAAAHGRELCVIVVASPVEEVGRDHDFDWAIVEPSSARSLVQTCGRVRRHRHDLPKAPNVAILTHNFAALTGARYPAFSRPGLETAARPFPTADAWKLLGQHSAMIDVKAQWCLQPTKHHLGQYENDNLKYWLGIVFEPWLQNDALKLVSNVYAKNIFRASDAHETQWVWVPDPEAPQASVVATIRKLEDGSIQSMPLKPLCPKRALWSWSPDDYGDMLERRASAAKISPKDLGTFSTQYHYFSWDPLYGFCIENHRF